MVKGRGPAPARRGGVYLAVLGAAIVVSLLGLSAMTVVRLELASSVAGADAMKARLYAESAIELGMLEIEKNALWRTKPNGAWSTDTPIGDGVYSLEVVDPADANLGNRATDPVLLRGTGKRGQARHMTEVWLQPRGPAIGALGAALHVAGQLHVQPAAVITADGAPLSTDATLRNEATINGDAECLLALPPGTVTGSLTIVSLPKSMPPSGIVSTYASLATPISPGTNTLEEFVLAPGVNPWGAPNADGLYRIDATSDITIRDARLLGTLVIRANGRRVRIDNTVLMERGRADYPVLIVEGDLEVRFTGTPATLSEAGVGANFNPAGAAYAGQTDTDTLDSYPSKIVGLIHVTGALTIEAPAYIHGAIIVQSGAASDAASLSSTPTIKYDPSLVTDPPMGYVVQSSMAVRPGSWRRVVSP